MSTCIRRMPERRLEAFGGPFDERLMGILKTLGNAQRVVILETFLATIKRQFRHSEKFPKKSKDLSTAMILMLI